MHRYPKGDRTRARIVAEAAALFAEKGYTSGSMRELAGRAGLTQAGLRHHFPDKSELLTEVLRLRDESVAEALRGVPDDSFATYVEEIIRHSTANPGLTSLYRVLSAEAGSPTHPAHEYFAARYRANLRAATERISREQERGTMPARVDARTIASALTALLDGLQVQAALTDDADPVAVVHSVMSGMLGAPGVA